MKRRREGVGRRGNRMVEQNIRECNGSKGERRERVREREKEREERRWRERQRGKEVEKAVRILG